MKRVFVVLMLICACNFWGCTGGVGDETSTHAESVADTMPPCMLYQGRYSTDWFEIQLPNHVYQLDGVGEVAYQDVSTLVPIGYVSESVENGVQLTKDLSTNLGYLVEPGVPVYSVELGGQAWIMVECVYPDRPGVTCQFFFGSWPLKKD